MLQECSTEGIDIGPWVFDFSDGAEDTRNGVKALSGKVTDVIILDVAVSESLEMQEARIGVTEDCVAIARNDLAFSESLAHIFLNDLLAGFCAVVVVLELSEPLQALLVGQAVQGTS